MDLKRILFPTDFSPASTRALPHALGLREKYGAELVLLHVATPYGEDPTRMEFQQLETGHHEEYVKQSMKQLFKEVGPSEHVTTQIARDLSPAQGILTFGEENGVDLVVMGTHGHSALVQFFLGSSAERVVRHAGCPVLTVASGRDAYISNADYRNILVAFDFSEHARAAALGARDVARRYNARLQVLYVVEQEVHPAFYGRWKNVMQKELPHIADAARESLRSTLGDEDFQVHVEVGRGKAHSEIVEFARGHEVDLIVMGTHGLSGVERMLLGSTTERIVRTASCPVLTFKLPEG